ncbi:MAG TPA: hypothetical protein IAC82_07600 [Candidatus Merdivicinus intestinigallinarum]|nr:hypothetical protein [Candidatus Merdivicinus intestinigallinarum]
MNLTANERQILRDLASRYMEIASLPVQAQKRDLWKALNRSKMERPMVAIDQLPWNELNADGFLTCKIADPFWQGIENQLRSTIYRWEHFPVDMVVEPFITIPKAISCTGYGISIEEETQATDETNSVVSHRFINQLQTEEDLEKIKDMHFTHDEAKSKLWMEEAAQVFEGIAPILQSGGTQFHLGVWDTISMLMGVENAYIELMDRPEFIHAIMEKFTHSVLNGIDEANKLGIVNDNINICHCSYIYTDELLPDFGQGKGPHSENCWAFGLAQLFSSVSPSITEEFELPYVTRMAEKFGMIYYGCCDRLDDRLDIVKRIPHVKKISCSPWSDRENFAEKIGPTIIMSNKPTPALVATDTLDEEEIRKDIRRTIDAAKKNNVNLELILKDISTVRYQPQRLTRWAEIAMEEVQR